MSLSYCTNSLQYPLVLRCFMLNSSSQETFHSRYSPFLGGFCVFGYICTLSVLFPCLYLAGLTLLRGQKKLFTETWTCCRHPCCDVKWYGGVIPARGQWKEVVFMKREDQQDATIRCLLLTSVSTCFGHQCSHPARQRPTTATNHIQQNQNNTPNAVTGPLFSWRWA